MEGITSPMGPKKQSAKMSSRLMVRELDDDKLSAAAAAALRLLMLLELELELSPVEPKRGGSPLLEESIGPGWLGAHPVPGPWLSAAGT